MDSRTVAVALITVGVVLVAAGLLAWTGALGWFGRLPGDIRLERGGTRFYLPITTMIVVSLLLTLLLSLIRRWW
ncbi:MAG: DUF2905 domain-containing protein [Longimicrobiaceae bacterium]